MKYCIICGSQIFGRQRKYCQSCKDKVHKKQMNNYYKENKCKWLCENGQYMIEKQRCSYCGSLDFCEALLA